MAGEVRARMVEGAIRLLATNGVQGTSFADVLELTGTPRGSVYHHFPGGKDELVAAAVARAAQNAVELLDRKAGADAVEVARFFLDTWRLILTRSGFAAGCALVAVTVGSDNRELLDGAAAAFRTWRDKLAELLAAGGVPADRAGQLAGLLLAASEGAVVFSRAEQDLGPFELVAAQLIEQVRAALVST